MTTVKYKFSLAYEMMEKKPLMKNKHDKLTQGLINIHDVNEIIKLSVSYIRNFAEESDEKRVSVINEILNECKHNGLENIIPFVTKGLLFFEESSENFREMIIENFIPDEEKEIISNLMQEMEELSENESFDKGTLERKSEIRAKLSDYQDIINGKIQEALKVNFKTDYFSNQIH